MKINKLDSKTLWEIMASCKKAQWLKSRTLFNDQETLLLINDTEFQKDIQATRKELGIPRLNRTRDQVDIPFSYEFGVKEYIDSNWLTTQPDEFINKYEERLDKLIDKYNLPLNLKDWIDEIVLYRTPKYYLPIPNAQLIHQVLENPNEIERIQLTTEEKAYLKCVARYVFQIKGRPSGATGMAYKGFVSMLEKSKNKQRRLKNVKQYAFLLNGKSVVAAMTNLYSFDDETSIGSKKLIERVKKQRQRAKLRLKKVEK